MSNSVLTSTSSWLGTLASPPDPSLNSKFSTIALGNSHGSRRSRGGLGFFQDGEEHEQSSRPSLADQDDLQSLGREVEAGWSITFAEGPKSRSRSRKPDPSLTVYVSTATSSLTLTRKLSEVVEFEARLQAQFPNRISSRALPTPIPMTPKKRNVLASLSRTLSPRRSSQNSHSSSSRNSASPLDLKDLSAALSKASFDPSIRSDATWRNFFIVRKDDLESQRIERRIKRARSDQTMHLGPRLSETNLSAMLPMGLGNQGSLGRSARQEMSGETTEVIDTPNLVDRPSYFDDASKGIKATMVVDSMQPVETVKIEPQEPVSMVASTAEEEVVEPIVARSIGEPVSTIETSSTPEEAKIAEDQELAQNDSQIPPANSTLSPSAALPSPSAKMSRSLSTNSAMSIEKRSKGVTIDSFEIMRVLGKGCAGKVLLVKSKGTDEHYAIKAITKRHVLAHRELDHTRTEQSVLKTCSRDKSNPFVVRLHYSFHDQDTLYLALDFHPGGDLATQLARWGRLGRDRARFYASEICEGVEGLHRAGIIYRDLKPENVLISANGHVVLTDFGLSKDFGHSSVAPPTSTLRDELPRPHWLSAHPVSRSASTPPATISSFNKRETTSTFCGTAEYLAPEVLLGDAYSYEVDAWSLGTMLYEMLAGITPFYAEDHSTMYKRVLHDELTFEEHSDYMVFDDCTKSFLRGMLQREPLLRMTDARIKAHPYFAMIDWSHVYHRRYAPPFVPIINPHNPADTSQFDDMFLSMTPQVEPDAEEEEASRDAPQGEPQPAFDDSGNDVFDGYSYFGRDSDSIKRVDMMEEDDDKKEEEEEAAKALSNHETDIGTKEEDHTLVNSQIEKMVEDSATPLDQGLNDSSSPVIVEEAERLGSQNSTNDVSGIIDSSMITSSTTSSSLATVSTQPTTAAADSPVATRRRQSSSLSNLEPVSEVSPAPLSTDIVFEENEEMSDSEWDVLDMKDIGGFSRNGGREATLFSRGIRDKYRLALAPLTSPVRSPQGFSGFRNGSRVGSRKASSSSAVSSLVGTSLSTTPEPPRSPSGILRFTSVRNKPKASLPFVSTQLSLSVDPLQSSLSHPNLPSPSSPRPSSSNSSTGKKMSSSFSTSNISSSTGSSFKKFTKLAFSPSSKNSQNT